MIQGFISSCCVVFISSLVVVCVVAQTSDNQKCRDPIANCDSSKNYFSEDEKVKFQFASDTIPEVSYANVYVDVTVNYTNVMVDGLPTAQRYRFVKCGCEAPSDGRQIVYIDPNGIYLDDSVSISMIDALDPSLKHLKYIKSAAFKYNRDLRNMVASGKVKEATAAQLSSDTELSAIIENPFGITGDEYSAASDSTPAIVVAEVDEKSPLARAEWVKFFGLYLNMGKLSNELFKNITTDYNNVVSKSAEVSRRPSVFFNAPSVPFGTDPSTPYPQKYGWPQPGGRTYLAEYMEAANVDYRFADNSVESSPQLSLAEIEGNFTATQFLLNADWFPGGAGRTMQQFLGIGQKPVDKKLETFLRQLTSVRCGNVISYSARVTEAGANDYFEQAVVRPDLLLADYVKLLHPDVNIGNHKLTFLYDYTQDESDNLKCPYASLTGKPNEGQVHVDKMFEIEGVSRFAVGDDLEKKVFPELKKGGVNVARTDFQFQAPKNGDDSNTKVLVRQEVPKDKEGETRGSSNVLDGFQTALGLPVKEVSIPKESSGLGTGAIVGIVIAAVVLFVLIGCIAFRLRGRTSPKQFANLGAAGELPVTS